MAPASAEYTALRILDHLRGGAGVAPLSTQSLERTLEQILTALIGADGAEGMVHLSDAAPDTLTPNQAAAAGVGTEASRADHAHGIPATGNPTSVQPQITADPGVATDFSRSDHQHGGSGSDTPVTQAFDDVADFGSGAVFARSNHRHGMPSGAAVAAAAGVGGGGAIGAFAPAGAGFFIPARQVGILTPATNYNQPGGVAFQGNYAYVTSNNDDRLNIADIRNPAAPAEVGSVTDGTHLNAADRLVVRGQWAYVSALSATKIQIVNIASPTSPTLSGATATGVQYSDLALGDDGNTLFAVSSGDTLLRAFDVTNRAAPSTLSTLADAVNFNGASGIAVVGDYAFVACNAGQRLVIVDISDPTAMVVVGSVIDATNLINAAKVAVQGNYAYVGNATGTPSRITVVDITTKTAPAVVGSVALTGGACRDIKVQGDFVYAACGNRALSVNVSDPTAPTLSGSATGTVANGIAVQDTTVGWLDDTGAAADSLRMWA